MPRGFLHRNRDRGAVRIAPCPSRLNTLPFAFGIALVFGLTSSFPGAALAAAGYGGGGAGGGGFNTGGSGGQGGGLSGGVGGAGGAARAGGPIGLGGAGGGDGITRGAFGGLPGMDGDTSSDGAAGGSRGSPDGATFGGGGGGGGVGVSLGAAGGNRGHTVSSPGPVAISNSLNGLPGWDSVFMTGNGSVISTGGGGGGGAGITVLAPSADLTVARSITIRGGKGGDVPNFWYDLSGSYIGGGGGGGAGLVMRSGTLTVVGAVNGGAGGLSPYNPGAGGGRGSDHLGIGGDQRVRAGDRRPGWWGFPVLSRAFAVRSNRGRRYGPVHRVRCCHQ